MLKHTCCIICLSINKRTINIYDTDMQCVYEKLANFKIRDDECWMCYICHTRLLQCHQLQQLAVQTRGLIDDIFQKKINIKLGAFGSLLKLTTSRTKITSTTLPHIKQESDGETEFYYDNSTLQDEILENTRETKIISTTIPPLYIKQELDIKKEFCSDDEIKQDEIVENVYEVETKPFIVSKDYLAGIKQELPNVDNIGAQQKSNILEINIVKISPSVNDKNTSQHPTTNSVTEVCIENWEEQAWREQSMEKAIIKQEIEEETGDEGLKQDDEQKNTNYCERRDHASEARSGCYKKPFSCDVCSKNFTWQSDLSSHIRMHTGEKPFSCDMCSKKFTRKSSLNIHIQTHTGVKSFSCDICSKKFTQKSHLNVHIQTHTGNKPFGCDICSKKFLLKSNLNSHILTHTGKKPFSCDICSKKFSRKSDLNVHKRIHIGYKPFSCDICSKKFSQKSHLNGHILTHRDNK